MASTKPRETALLAPAARRDIRSLLLWSEKKFGKAAAVRYENLLIQAIVDITANPGRPGSKERFELSAGIMTYHLAFSRDRVAGDKVKDARHFLAFRVQESHVEIVRVLHDSSDLGRHLSVNY